MVNMLRNLKMKTKLAAAFAIVILLFAAAIIVTYLNVKDANDSYSNLIGVNVGIRLCLADEDAKIIAMSAAMRGYALYKDEKYYNDYLKLREQFANNIRELENLLDADKQQVDLSPLKNLEMEYYQMVQEMVAKGRAKDFEGAVEIATAKGRGIAEKLVNEITRLGDVQKKILEHERTSNAKQVSDTLTTLIVLSLVAVLLAAAASVLISRLVTVPIVDLNRVMQQVAGGDLRVMAACRSKDELGQMAGYFNAMIDSLREIITKINEGAVSLMASTQQISASTQQIASGSEEQANTAQTVNRLAAEMASAIEEVAKSAEQASVSSQKAVEAAKKGGEVVDKSIKGMETINEKITDLEVNSSQIGEIVYVIEDVAEQTNLLALNAAIEAARAGEAGKGFAVVADEVRKLAERSGAATKDIEALIKNIQKNTGSTVKAATDGVELTRQLGDSFREIIKSIEVSAAKVSDIAAASEEQAVQASDVVTSVQGIASVTEESSASAEETAATSQDIARMAEELGKVVSRFKLH